MDTCHGTVVQCAGTSKTGFGTTVGQAAGTSLGGGGEGGGSNDINLNSGTGGNTADDQTSQPNSMPIGKINDIGSLFGVNGNWASIFNGTINFGNAATVRSGSAFLNTFSRLDKWNPAG